MPPKRPAAVAVGELHAYPMRPPLAGSRDWYWRVVVHRDGRQVTVPKASRRMPTKDVPTVLARLLVDGAADAGPASGGEIRTVADLLEAYCADVNERPGGNRATYRSHLRRAKRVEGLIGSAAISAVSASTVDRLVRQLVAEGLHRDGIKGLLATLRAAWAWCLERELIPNRPLARARLPPPERVHNDYTPTSPEVSAVLGQLAVAPAWVRHIVALLRATGCRPHEVGAMTRGDVHRWTETAIRDGKPVDVLMVALQVPDETKTGARVVGIAEGAITARAVLDEILSTPGDASDRLIPVSMAAIDHASRYLYPACDRAGLPRWTLYGLRRLVSSTLVEGGVDPITYAEHMGHSWDLRTVYARTRPSSVRAAAELLGEDHVVGERWKGRRKKA